MDSVQEIKGKLAIEDVVTPYVQLKRAGKYLKGICPFHDEKTPSFFVSPERQIAYCFSCQKGGDHFQFIQDIEGVDFKEALQILADKAGVELKPMSGKPKISKDVKDRLKSANADASKYFVQQLWDTDDGKKVMSYLKNRGMDDDTLKTFAVGFAPEGWDNLYRHLLNKKHEKDDILASSLAVSRDSSADKIIDRFRLRLMFPIDNSQGDIVAFGGRALKSGDQPKYLNSPEYVLYNKGSLLYNLSRAKASIREKDIAVVVEGYFDVMASHQAGVENVVATSGTALTEQQFKLMKRYTKRVALAFDSDSAGQAALLRAIHVAQALELELFVIEIPEGKDAADAVKENPELWLNAVEARQPYLEFFEARFKQQFDLNEASGKRAYTDAFLDLLRGVKHPVERDHYLKRLSKEVGTPIDMLYDYLGQMKAQHQQRAVRQKETEVPSKAPKHVRLVEYFMGLLLAFPQIFFEAWKQFESYEDFESKVRHLGLVTRVHDIEESSFRQFYLDFENALNSEALDFDASSVYKQVRDHYNLHGEIDEAFFAGLDDAKKLRQLAFEAEVKNPEAKLIKNEFTKLITILYLAH